MKTTFTVPIAIIAGGAIVAAAVYFSNLSPSTGSDTGNPSLVRPVNSADHILGNPAAKVFIVEYSDFDCAYCKQFHDTLGQVIATVGANGSIAWVFRHFPLTELHANAQSHARAAECAATAGGTEAFWKFADSLFENQPVDPKNYGAYAQAAGIPVAAFSSCYVNAASTVDARIAADRENAMASGARGTPYSLIIMTGKAPIVVDGAYSYDALKELISEALAD